MRIIRIAPSDDLGKCKKAHRKKERASPEKRKDPEKEPRSAHPKEKRERLKERLAGRAGQE